MPTTFQGIRGWETAFQQTTAITAMAIISVPMRRRNLGSGRCMECGSLRELVESRSTWIEPIIVPGTDGGCAGWLAYTLGRDGIRA